MTERLRLMLEAIELEPRRRFLPAWLAPIASVLVALSVGAVVLLLGGHPLSAQVNRILRYAGSRRGIAETLLLAGPLILTGVGVSTALKAGFWNIGGEGQLLFGATVGFGLSRIVTPTHDLLAIAVGAVAAALAGGILCASVAVGKIKRNIDEVFATLLLNFGMLHFVGYLVTGPWRDPVTHWIQSGELDTHFRFARLANWDRLNSSSFVIAALVTLFLFAERRSYLGPACELTGDNPAAPEAVGLSSQAILVLAAFASGSLCGFAGWVEMAGTQYRLIENLSPGYGYLALLLAVLARGRLAPTVLAAVGMAAVLNVFDVTTRVAAVPTYLQDVIFGVALIAHALLNTLFRHRLQMRRGHSSAVA